MITKSEILLINAIVAKWPYATEAAMEAYLLGKRNHSVWSADEENKITAAAHRLALELECLLLSCDNPAATKWWDSAHEALEQYRQITRFPVENPAEFPINKIHP